MTDTFSRQERSSIMSRIRSRGNAATELYFVEILRKYKINGWRRGKKLPGRPDFVFPAQCLVVFIDGDFWHGNPNRFRIPKSNSLYWERKIRGNQKRDKYINRLLRSHGWKVYRFWQSSLKKERIIIAKLRRGLS